MSIFERKTKTTIKFYDQDFDFDITLSKLKTEFQTGDICVFVDQEKQKKIIIEKGCIGKNVNEIMSKYPDFSEMTVDCKYFDLNFEFKVIQEPMRYISHISSSSSEYGSYLQCTFDEQDEESVLLKLKHCGLLKEERDLSLQGFDYKNMYFRNEFEDLVRAAIIADNLEILGKLHYLYPSSWGYQAYEYNENLKNTGLTQEGKNALLKIIEDKYMLRFYKGDRDAICKLVTVVPYDPSLDTDLGKFVYENCDGKICKFMEHHYYKVYEDADYSSGSIKHSERRRGEKGMELWKKRAEEIGQKEVFDNTNIREYIKYIEDEYK